MTAPALPEVQRVARDVVQQLSDQPADIGALWQLDGRATSGKSSALELIATQLAGRGELLPVVVAPPARHLDAGPAALVDVAWSLAKHGLLDGAFDDWIGRRETWRERVHTVRGWLQEHHRRIVLLCDEPLQWGANRMEGDFFAGRSADVANLLIEQAPCRRIVAGRLPASAAPLTRIQLHTVALDYAWFADDATWGELAEAAQELLDAGLDLAAYTPLEARLLVAGVVVTSLADVRRWVQEPRPAIAQRLAAAVAGSEQHRALWEIWNALSLTRRRFPAELVERLEISDLTGVQRAVVERCLLFGGELLRLHDVLRVQAARWRDTTNDARVRSVLADANRRLFGFYAERFAAAQAAGDPRAVVDSLEAFHFASSTGEPALLDEVAPVFVEQLDALGWSLSYEHGRFADAAAAFEQALHWDAEDDYAHHYLAYNLERQAGDPERIDEHYAAAVELNSVHPWWHARYIRFLLSRGRVDDARDCWEEALVALGVGEGDADADLYATLHCWVAGALLTAGELSFAREVLEEVPLWMRDQIAIYPSLRRRLEALLEADAIGAFVPAGRLRPGWWREGPELLQSRLGDGRQLVRWLAARVESSDQDGLHLRAMEITSGHNEKPRVAWTTISFDEFDGRCRDPIRARELREGRHLEIGLYAPPEGSEGSVETLIRVPDERPWTDGLAVSFDDQLSAAA